MEGESLRAKEIIHNPRVAQRLGEALGGMHLRMKQFTRADKFPEKDLYHSVYGWAMQELSFDPELTKIYEQLHDEFGQVIRGLPKQVIHRDVHLFNIIFKDETILGMIDFDLVEVNTRVFDLCYCATSVLNEIFGDSQLREEWIDFVSSLVSGYQLADSLTDEENQSIWYVMLAIQSIFMAYFVHQADLFRTNKEMFLWIFENRKKVESTL